MKEQTHDFKVILSVEMTISATDEEAAREAVKDNIFMGNFSEEIEHVIDLGPTEE